MDSTGAPTRFRESKRRGQNPKQMNDEITREASCSTNDPPPASQKKRRLHTYERARAAYERIQAERKAERERQQAERESRQKALESYLSTKRKMDKALKKRNKKGQPKLNAQIEVLLEKIQKRQSQ
ncbi:unnamed protein product [Anisakis simplex]|uniref:BZIP domain-containing protein n=1 Tax=Anisakis simplex TaxID=6269 RepID=A0A0M3J8G8_ANISI|nr:unnamed protein product [Anisakis simplex]